jgi:hypothetical protein
MNRWPIGAPVGYQASTRAGTPRGVSIIETIWLSGSLAGR